MKFTLSLGAVAAAAAVGVGFIALQPRAAQADTAKESFNRMQKAYHASQKRGEAFSVSLLDTGVPDNFRQWVMKDGSMIPLKLKVTKGDKGETIVQLDGEKGQHGVMKLHLQGDGHNFTMGSTGSLSIQMSDQNGKKSVQIIKDGKKLEEKDMSPELRKAVQAGDHAAIMKAMNLPMMPKMEIRVGKGEPGTTKVYVNEDGKMMKSGDGKSFVITKSVTRDANGKVDELKTYEVDGVKVDELTLRDEMKKRGFQEDKFVLPDIDKIMSGKLDVDLKMGGEPHIIICTPKDGENVRYRVVQDPKTNLPASVIKEKKVKGAWVRDSSAEIKLRPMHIRTKSTVKV